MKTIFLSTYQVLSTVPPCPLPQSWGYSGEIDVVPCFPGQRLLGLINTVLWTTRMPRGKGVSSVQIYRDSDTQHRQEIGLFCSVLG